MNKDSLSRRGWLLAALGGVAALAVGVADAEARPGHGRGRGRGQGWGVGGVPPGHRRRGGWIPPGHRRGHGPPPGRGWRRWD